MTIPNMTMFNLEAQTKGPGGGSRTERAARREPGCGGQMKSLEALEKELKSIVPGMAGHEDNYYLHRRLELIAEILIEILREVCTEKAVPF